MICLLIRNARRAKIADGAVRETVDGSQRNGDVFTPPLNTPILHSNEPIHKSVLSGLIIYSPLEAGVERTSDILPAGPIYPQPHAARGKGMGVCFRNFTNGMYSESQVDSQNVDSYADINGAYSDINGAYSDTNGAYMLSGNSGISSFFYF